MSFKIKDLMITVLPDVPGGTDPVAAPPCGGCTNCTGCTGCTFCSNCSGCSICTGCSQCSGCTVCGSAGCTRTCYITLWLTDPAQQAPALEMLRAQLGVLYSRMGPQQAALAAPAQPRTAAEIELLEQKLAEALADLRQQRQELGKSSPGQPVPARE